MRQQVKITLILTAFLASLLGVSTASAMDIPGTGWIKDGLKHDKFYFRAGITHLQPHFRTKTVELANLSNVAQLAVDSGPLEDTRAKSEPLTFPSAIVGYTLPWDEGQWSVETLLALPLTMKLEISGKYANQPLATEALGIPTGVPALGNEVGETKAAPPLITLVYRFNPHGEYHPYVGAGFTYLFTYDAKVTNPILTEFGRPKLDIKDRFGGALQAGFEYNIYKKWWATLDVKYLYVPKLEATMKDAYISAPGLPQYNYIRVGDAHFVADVDPLIFHFGIGFAF